MGGRWEAAAARAAEADADGDTKPPPPSLGKMLQLAGPELPFLGLTMLLRIGVEGTGLIIPLLTGNAFDAVVRALGSSPGGEPLSPEVIAAGSREVAGIMTLVLCLHAGSQLLTFTNMAITGTSGEVLIFIGA